MPLMDEFKAEREQIKNRSFKEKLSYFWDYYKWWVIGVVVAIIAIVATVHNILTRKDNTLYVAMMNVYEHSEGLSDNLGDAFLEQHGIDTKKNTVYFDNDLAISLDSNSQTNYTNIQKISVYMMAGDIDLVVSNAEVFNMYAYQGVFVDLRELMTADELAAYEGSIYYYDLDWYDKYNSDEYSFNDIRALLPDPRYPEKMGRPVPVAIFLENSECYNQYFYTNLEDTIGVVAGVTTSSKAKDLATEFLKEFSE